MQLLELDDGQTSLELSADELEKVLFTLSVLPDFRREPRASYELVCVLGSELILANDWDEPSLLSRDTFGAALLRALAGSESLKTTFLSLKKGRGTTHRAVSRS